MVGVLEINLKRWGGVCVCVCVGGGGGLLGILLCLQTLLQSPSNKSLRTTNN